MQIDSNKLIDLLPHFTFEQVMILLLVALFGGGLGFLMWKLGTRIALAIEKYLTKMEGDVEDTAKKQETILSLIKKVCRKMDIEIDY